MNGKSIYLILGALCLLILLSACSQGTNQIPSTEIVAFTPESTAVPTATTTPTQEPTSTSTVPPTSTTTSTKEPTATSPPPTSTPSLTPSPTLEPTEPLPEFQVLNLEELVGTWQTEKFGLERLTFKSNGDFEVFSGELGKVVNDAKCHFEGDNWVCVSPTCYKWEDNIHVKYTCTSCYKLFITRNGDLPVKLRFEVVEDPYGDRRNDFEFNEWSWQE